MYRYKAIESFIRPSSLVVVGASLKEGSVGYAITKNFINSSFQGKSYLVNPKYKTLFEKKCYDSVLDIKQTIELAIIAIPAKFIPKVIAECGKAGIQSVIIISSGFMEIGDKGEELLQQVLSIIRKYGIRLLGPNCIGVLNPSIHMNAGFYAHQALNGTIAMVSQSGAVSAAILDWSIMDQFGFSSMVSLGSMSDINFSDLLEYFYEDEFTEYIILYIENILDSARFISVCSKVSQKKPIIVIKAGTTNQGAIAAMSHTGSMAGNDKLYDAIFRKANVVRLSSISDLYQTIKALAKVNRPVGKRLAIITNGGGPGILATDKHIALGGKLATLSKATIDHLDKVLSKNWSGRNPIDVLGDADADTFLQAILACEKDDNVDGIYAIFVTQAVSDPNLVAQKLVDNKHEISKPLMCTWLGGTDVDHARVLFNQNDIPHFDFPATAIKVVNNMVEIGQSKVRHNSLERTSKKSIDHHAVSAIFSKLKREGRNRFYENEAKLLLSFYGFLFPKNQTINNATQLKAACCNIGFPLAMKMISPDVGHKLDLGGVILNVQNEQEALQKYKQLMEHLAENHPKLQIVGVLIEEMISVTHEFLLGGLRDQSLGPAVMFGKGGSLTELWDDNVLIIPPILQDEAKKAIRSTRSFDLIRGFRGMPEVDEIKLSDRIIQLGKLLLDYPQIKEIDINPIAWSSTNELIALDASIILSN